MSPNFNALTLALAALQDTGVPRNPLQLDAIESLRQAIQEEKNSPKKVAVQDVVDLMTMHHNLAQEQHNYFQHMANMVQITFGK